MERNAVPARYGRGDTFVACQECLAQEMEALDETENYTRETENERRHVDE